MAVLIKGGHGVSNKHFVTPQGVMTKVSDDDMSILLKNDAFKRHCEKGFMHYEKKYINPEKAAKNMENKDGSAPYTPADYETGKNSEADQKIYKSKEKMNFM
jgi:hypothetical protein